MEFFLAVYTASQTSSRWHDSYFSQQINMVLPLAQNKGTQTFKKQAQKHTKVINIIAGVF